MQTFITFPAPPPRTASMAARIASGLEAVRDLRGFLPPAQAELVRNLIRRSDERDFFIVRMRELAALVRAMPETYQQEGKGMDTVASLHYFYGGCDWYITEKDKGDPDDGPDEFQSQAFGYACLGDPDCAEFGYISLPEIFSVSGVEMDFHFTPCPVREVLRK